MSAEEMLEAKQLGYSDIQIAQRTGETEKQVRGVHILLRARFGNGLLSSKASTARKGPLEQMAQ